MADTLETIGNIYFLIDKILFKDFNIIFIWLVAVE